jgi:phage tail-like protein
MTGGWLVDQLPRAIAEDPVLAGIAAIAQEVAGSFRSDLDAIDQHLDVAAASAPMLRYLASWVGADLDPSISVDRQREVLRRVGSLLGWRGTQRGLEGILEALTGARVRVQDSGGVWTSSQPRPGPGLAVLVEIDDLGELSAAQLRAYVAEEVPVGAQVELRVAGTEQEGADSGPAG